LLWWLGRLGWLLCGGLAGEGVPELGWVEEGVDPVEQRLEERTWKDKNDNQISHLTLRDVLFK
jgi:hypothetical protein